MNTSTVRITIKDDFLFGTIMRHKEFCKPLLEAILGIKIRDLSYVNDQETMAAEVPGSRSIRLDVYVEDDNNTVYDIEIQTTWKKGLPKRTRMYQALMDIRAMGKGEDFTKLKKSFIIFICDYDPFGRKRYVYTFSRRCNEENDVVLKDDATVVVINIKGSKGDISDDLRNLIDYFRDGKAENEYTKALDAEVDAYNADEKWRMDRMMLMEAYATHEDIGEYRGIVKAIRRRLERNPAALDADYAADFGITEAMMGEVVQTIKDHPEWDDMKIACEITWDE